MNCFDDIPQDNEEYFDRAVRLILVHEYDGEMQIRTLKQPVKAEI